MKRTYKIRDTTLTLEFGDITSSTAEVLVSSDDYRLTMSGGVSSALLRAAGPVVRLDAAKHSPARLGDVLITTAGSLSAKYIFHAITIGPGELPPVEVLRKTTRRALQLLDALELSSIAFPAIGSGMAGFSYDDVAVEMADTIADSIGGSGRAFQITLYLFDRFQRMGQMDFIRFFEEFAARSKVLGTTPPPSPSALRRAAPSELTEEDILLEESIVSDTIAALNALEAERHRIETSLVQVKNPSRLDSMQGEKQLAELQRRRLQLLSKLAGHPSAPLIFVSYSEDSAADGRWAKLLVQQLSALERMGTISLWHYGKLDAGMDRDATVRKHLLRASVILVLVSPDYDGSPSCEAELDLAFKQQARSRAVVIPVTIRPVASMHPKLTLLQKLPRNGKPAAQWPTEDEAVVDIIEGVKDTLSALQELHP